MIKLPQDLKYVWIRRVESSPMLQAKSVWKNRRFNSLDL